MSPTRLTRRYVRSVHDKHAQTGDRPRKLRRGVIRAAVSALAPAVAILGRATSPSAASPRCLSIRTPSPGGDEPAGAPRSGWSTARAVSPEGTSRSRCRLVSGRCTTRLVRRTRLRDAYERPMLAAPAARISRQPATLPTREPDCPLPDEARQTLANDLTDTRAYRPPRGPRALRVRWSTTGRRCSPEPDLGAHWETLTSRGAAGEPGHVDCGRAGRGNRNAAGR
jgi:hypothetical protein